MQDRSDGGLSLGAGVPVCFDQVDLCKSHGQVFVGSNISLIACRLFDFVSEAEQIIHINVENISQGLDHLEAGLSLAVFILGNCHFI